MTKYTVTVEDKQYKIDVTKSGNEKHFKIKVDEKPVEVEFAEKKFEHQTPMQIKIGGKIHIVEISKTGKQAPYTVKIKDVPLKVEVRTQLPHFAIQTAEAHSSTAMTIKSPTGKTVTEGTATAPMAGKIVSIKVKRGDAVKAGMVICILEAMKMENEIVAPKTGMVQEINVSEGAAVSEGDVLIVIK